VSAHSGWRAVVLRQVRGDHASTSSSSTAGRILGDDLDGEAHRNQPLPTQPNHVSRHNSLECRPEHSPDLVRDEEAVGSNPATPTTKAQVRG
jgi:hypothetical protein